MTGVIKLPVVPRPFGDELLSSWMVRVAGRYGMEVPGLTSFLLGERNRAHDLPQVDDAEPNPDLLKIWARGCRIDPVRLKRQSLKFRYPKRPQEWFLDRAGSTAPACLACFDADFTVGRDSYMRSHWRLAEHVVCPVHKEMLRDRCPACSGHLRASFRMRDGLLRPFCGNCDSPFTGRGGAAAGPSDAEFAAGVLELQRQVQRIVRGDAEHRARLEHKIRILWAPLDRVGAARPVLALWFDQPGWHCPFEVCAAVGAHAPLLHQPVCWRVLTMVILRDLFGADLVSDTALPEAALSLFRRAAPMPRRRQGRASAIGKGKNSIEGVPGRVQRLSKSPVHRLSGNFEGERASFGRIQP